MTPFEWIGIFSLFFEVTSNWYFRVYCSLLWGIVMVFVMVQHVRYFLRSLVKDKSATSTPSALTVV
jgi:hypothetical protein